MLTSREFLVEPDCRSTIAFALSIILLPSLLAIILAYKATEVRIVTFNGGIISMMYTHKIWWQGNTRNTSRVWEDGKLKWRRRLWWYMWPNDRFTYSKSIVLSLSERNVMKLKSEKSLLDWCKIIIPWWLSEMSIKTTNHSTLYKHPLIYAFLGASHVYHQHQRCPLYCSI